MKYFTTHFKAQWKDALAKLEKEEKYLHLCTDHWKASHIISCSLQNFWSGEKKECQCASHQGNTGINSNNSIKTTTPTASTQDSIAVHSFTSRKCARTITVGGKSTAHKKPGKFFPILSAFSTFKILSLAFDSMALEDESSAQIPYTIQPQLDISSTNQIDIGFIKVDPTLANL